MSEFNRLFNSFFKTKTKNFYIIILFQLIAALVITFFPILMLLIGRLQETQKIMVQVSFQNGY